MTFQGDSTGSRVIMSVSVLVALELFEAIDKLLKDQVSSETVAQALGIPPHLIQDIRAGKMRVNMEEVTHWIAHFALRKHYPSLHGYTSNEAPGLVVRSLELLIRAG